MRRIERWLFAPGPAERLAALRIGLSLVLLLRLSRDIYADLSAQPAALFRPRSFMNLLASQPPRPVVIAVQAAGIAAAILAIVGFRARAALPVAWGAALFLAGMVTSNGKVMHNDVMLLLAAVPLLAAPHSDARSLDARRRGHRPRPDLGYGWGVRAALVVVAGGYFFSGLQKLVNSGPGWVTSDNLRWVLYASSDGQATPNAAALFVAERAWLAHLLAGATLFLELTFPLALFRPRAAPLYAAGAIGMHLGIRLAMGLDYWAWVGTVAVVMIDWPAVLARARLRVRQRAPQRGVATGAP